MRYADFCKETFFFKFGCQTSRLLMFQMKYGKIFLKIFHFHFQFSVFLLTYISESAFSDSERRQYDRTHHTADRIG